MFNITIDDLLLKIKDPDDIPIIKKAYEYALKFSDEETINKAINIVDILFSLNVDNVTIVSTFLYDTIDFDENIKDEIINNFGEEVYTIVNSLSKINNLEMVDESENSAIYLRKVMVGLSEDVRVLFIKLAERLYIMRNMKDESKEYQKKISNETLSVLVPIAHRLGIYKIKSDLENLCLYYLKPEVYNDILEKLNDTASELNDYLIEMKDSISEILEEAEIKFEIKGRVKSVYSIYNKLSNGKKWEDIYDILALRVFVEKESDCYAVIGLIHSKYRPLEKRFKDYIAMPKENMYQSLHTTVVGVAGKFYEIQIRTYEMDEIAEKGIASHWSYKEKGSKKIQNIMEQKLELYRNIIENTKETEDSEFASIVDKEILSELIYVFTPKGDVVELPKNATPIDFAYRIHSHVGDTMVGAIVNDQMVPITSSLKDEDVVKILTNPSSKPTKDWLNYVKTSQAKNKIKAYFSKIDKEEYIAKGKSILEKEIRRRKISINDVLSNDNIDKLLHGLKLRDLDDLYGSIGSFRYTAGFIINYVLESDSVSDSLVVKRRVPIYKSKLSEILVDNKENILTHLAKCCNPVKGDNIIGVITKNEGIAVHRKDCININENTEKCVDVTWINRDNNNTYVTKLLVETSSTKSVVSDLIATITNKNATIIKIDIKDSGIYDIEIRVKNLDELNDIIRSIYNLRYVKEVNRI